MKERLEKIIGIFAKLIRHSPSNKDLERVFADAVCAEVYDALLISEPKFLIKLQGEDFPALIELLKIVDGSGVLPAIEAGDFVLKIVKSDGTCTELRHLGDSFRHPKWLLDGRLVDGNAFESWLTDEKKVTLGELHSKKKQILARNRGSSGSEVT